MERESNEQHAEFEFQAPEKTIEPADQPANLKDEKPETKIMLTYESLPLEEQHRITDLVVDKMRSILRDIPDYAIFASTAMYLNGKRMRALKDPDAKTLLEVAPGDLDVAVGSMESLERIKKSLKRMPGVELANDGEIKRLADSRDRVLAGSITVPWKPADVKYDFEFFNEQKIVHKDVLRERTQVDGVWALNLDGLQRQYLNVLELEGRVNREVMRAREVLVADPSIRTEIERPDPLPDELQKTLDSLQLTRAEVQTFFDLEDRLAKTEERIAEAESETKKKDLQKDYDDLIARRAILLSGGLKTKIPKRIKNIHQLAKLRGHQL